MEKNIIVSYRIWDCIEKRYIGATYTNRKRAETRADKLDIGYGAYRYYTKKIFSTENETKQ